MASLMKLSAELKLSIIEYLEPVRFPHKPCSSSQQSRKAEALKENPWIDLLSLSRVNRDIRALVIPYIFSSITLRNTEKSGASVQAIAQGLHASCVQTLHYAPNISDMVPWSFGEEGHGVEEAKPEQFPDVVRHVLENLAIFGNCKRLTVEFIIVNGRFDGLAGCMDLFGKPGDPSDALRTKDQIIEAEAKEGWHALMKRSYDAIAQNTPGTITSLEIRNLVPQLVSSWLKTPWHAFLNGVETFTLTLRGGQDGMGNGMLLYIEYAELVRNLGVYFFDHLGSVTHFRFEATVDGPVGCAGPQSQVAFPFRGDHMPKLKHLELGYVFISKQLLDTLHAHKDTLETIHLWDCVALDTSHLVDEFKNPNELCWAHFCDGIRAYEPTRLCELVVERDKMLEDCAAWDDVFADLQERGPGRRVFVYGSSSEEHGDFALDEEVMFERFERGEDQRAWDGLVEVVEGNAGRAEGMVAKV